MHLWHAYMDHRASSRAENTLSMPCFPMREGLGPCGTTIHRGVRKHESSSTGQQWPGLHAYLLQACQQSLQLYMCGQCRVWAIQGLGKYQNIQGMCAASACSAAGDVVVQIWQALASIEKQDLAQEVYVRHVSITLNTTFQTLSSSQVCPPNHLCRRGPMHTPENVVIFP